MGSKRSQNRFQNLFGFGSDFQAQKPSKITSRGSQIGAIWASFCWLVSVFVAVGFQVGSKSFPRHPPDPLTNQKRSSRTSDLLQKYQKMSSKTSSKPPCSTSKAHEHWVTHTQKTQKAKQCHGATQTQKTLEVRQSRASVLNIRRACHHICHTWHIRHAWRICHACYDMSYMTYMSCMT